MFERQAMEWVYSMDAMHFLNDLSYLKAKEDHDKRLLDARNSKR